QFLLTSWQRIELQRPHRQSRGLKYVTSQRRTKHACHPVAVRLLRGGQIPGDGTRQLIGAVAKLCKHPDSIPQESWRYRIGRVELKRSAHAGHPASNLAFKPPIRRRFSEMKTVVPCPANRHARQILVMAGDAIVPHVEKSIRAELQ